MKSRVGFDRIEDIYMNQQKSIENKYTPADIEAKWQDKWESNRTFSPDIKAAKDPYFNLMMFPYPSAEGLHVGNMYAFTGADVYAKFQRMQGNDVLEPIGLDGFGIHSENYALKVGRHPKEQAEIAEKNFYRQMRSIGNSFDWQRTVETYNPNYYKWTQWLFVTLFKAGLAYRDTALVNWCPKDMTVLSDEQVIDGCCERCGEKVEKKNLEQWFFRITKYADRLLKNIEGLDWSNKVKIAQTNWIGKSEGLVFEAPVKDTKLTLKTFSAHFEAFYADTFVVIAPDHPFLESILEGVENREEIKAFCKETLNKRAIEREGEEKEPEGIFTGRYIIDPIGNGDLPIWVANFALKDYGTGIVKCSAHDTRDFAFAKKYGIRLKPVLFPEDSVEAEKVKNLEVCYTDMVNGVLAEPSEFKGRRAGEVREEIITFAKDKGFATTHSTYHLRDWLISRQRYWGPPIPMIFCDSCQKNGKAEVEGMEGWFCVPEAQLPILLPDVEDWKPMGTGKAPLANHPEFYKTTCPSCGGEATRETDVSDTFLDSSWYFLRYPSTDVSTAPFDIQTTRKWLPVNMYIGGAEHSVLHLLYSRFVTMVLKDLGYLNFEEPFSTFFAHGLIIKDGAKMSKSKGNVVVPDEYIGKYGADTLRTYLMFIGPYSDGGDFRDSGIEGMNRFLRKVWKLLSQSSKDEAQLSNERTMMMHKTIQGVTKDISEFGYNTAIAKLMEWYNSLNQEVRVNNQELSKEEVGVYLRLLAPFAPHMTEELWQSLGYRKQGAGFSSIHMQKWPKFDEYHLISSNLIIPVQINGKRRGEITVSGQGTGDSAQIEKLAREAVSKNLEGIEVKKVIYIPGKIVNFVV